MTRRCVLDIVARSKAAVMEIEFTLDKNEKSELGSHVDTCHGDWECENVHGDTRNTVNDYKLRRWFIESASQLQ